MKEGKMFHCRPGDNYNGQDIVMTNGTNYTRGSNIKRWNNNDDEKWRYEMDGIFNRKKKMMKIVSKIK
jgi:hypothetical protein